MKLSLAATHALNYMRNNQVKYEDTYSLSYTSKPILSYIYYIENIGIGNGLIISSLMLNLLRQNNYIEHTRCKDNIIYIKLNKKYFDDLESKQEI